LIGGECAYWACIPSKTLVRMAEARAEVERAAGVGGASLDWQAARHYRDEMIRQLDDGAQVHSLSEQGAIVIKADARLVAPGRVRAGQTEITADHLVIATGTAPMVPDIPGLGEITAWTNRETYTATELPDRAIVVGGSAVGVETATFLAGFGVEVVMLQRGERLLGREEPRVGELVLEQLREAGVDVRLGAEPARARRDGGASVLELQGGGEVAGDVVIFCTGRTPQTAELGLGTLGVEPGDGGEVPVDEHCRVADGVWAVGDVTGVMPFTHVAKYQGRIAADAILGRPRPATYNGIPRVVFGIPEIAAVGLTAAQAEERGIRTAAIEVDVAEALARPSTYEQDPRGWLALLADAEDQVLVGAWALGPLAGEWIHYAALAIRARLPLDVLRDQVQQFPTFHEAYRVALEQLGR